MRSAASADPALFYVDTSALVKLVIDEPETEALESFLADANLASCELVLTEIPRAIRRAAADRTDLLDTLLARSGELLETLVLIPLDQHLLLAAGALAEPLLRALDAIHVAAAIDISPLEAFVSYDARQSAAARLAGLRTVGPGTPSTRPA
jgi:predicted nucleic acid-binding protein